MITRKQVSDEVKTWVGTPYQHQARCKGAGVDCAMLVAGVCVNLNLLSEDDLKHVPPYPRDWHMHQDIPLLTDIMAKLGCVSKSIEARDVGDILVFKIGRVPSHLAIIVEDGMVHAYSGSQQTVVHHSLTEAWLSRAVECYGLPGVE